MVSLSTYYATCSVLPCCQCFTFGPTKWMHLSYHGVSVFHVWAVKVCHLSAGDGYKCKHNVLMTRDSRLLRYIFQQVLDIYTGRDI